MSRRASSESSRGSAPGEGSASLPARDVEDSLPQGAELTGDVVETTTTSRKPSAQLAHEQEMERIKELHRQKLELETTARKRETEHRNWQATVVLMSALVLTCIGVLFWIQNEDIKKAALAGLFTIFASWMSFFAGRGSAKGSD